MSGVRHSPLYLSACNPSTLMSSTCLIFEVDWAAEAIDIIASANATAETGHWKASWWNNPEA